MYAWMKIAHEFTKIVIHLNMFHAQIAHMSSLVPINILISKLLIDRSDFPSWVVNALWLALSQNWLRKPKWSWKYFCYHLFSVLRLKSSELKRRLEWIDPNRFKYNIKIDWYFIAAVCPRFNEQLTISRLIKEIKWRQKMFERSAKCISDKI